MVDTTLFRLGPPGPPMTLPGQPAGTLQAITRTFLMDIVNATGPRKICKTKLLEDKPAGSGQPAVIGDHSGDTDDQLYALFDYYDRGGGTWDEHRHGPGWTQEKTPFDIDLSARGLHFGKGVFIVVRVSDPMAQFFADCTLAVTGGSTEALKSLYLVKAHYPQPIAEPRFISFRANCPDARLPENKYKLYSSFNIGVVLTQVEPDNTVLRLPTFYDPKVKNDGTICSEDEHTGECA